MLLIRPIRITRPFDDSSNGVVDAKNERSCGKPLASAVRDARPVLDVISGNVVPNP
jgi:hypothetical protein